MSVANETPGRRERNKQAKLERITAVATELFATHSVDEVTTQQIADAADIGAGTLFLYAKTKGELLLLAQNALYEVALERGLAASAAAPSALAALMALVEPVVRCNRAQIDNGRAYLREMVFGDPTEPHHAAALAIVGRTEAAAAALLVRHLRLDLVEAQALASVVSAVLFLTMSRSDQVDSSVEQLLTDVRTQLAAALPR
ncbi:TetR/AcrR family transcriptional regulator [Microbacterium sp. lyk4-40-TSB-66]|uniref:TetR/AcrR family transcriptional regulator n=1 Tax=Microbacterium sp. lyk4-40-TSB-66 TaxID=3040294 RepID=UPI00254A0337|nr:TetR/AcrR family transcriptional regulator [Microbacterium sp. lyk4-40-TSB-66]